MFEFRTQKPGTGTVRGAALAVALLLAPLCAAPGSASADDDAPKPAPRTSVVIGEASVVLVAANDQLYAYVDRLADNAPVADAALSAETAEGVSIPMRTVQGPNGKITPGLLIGPLKRQGRMQDAFMISLKSSSGSGDAPVEITYSDVEATRSGTTSDQAVKPELLILAGAALVVVLLLVRKQRATPA